MGNNSTGRLNSAQGFHVLFRNTTGRENTASDAKALSHNETGDNNTAIGVGALYGNQTGSTNLALGHSAGSNTTGHNNIMIANLGVPGESNTIRLGEGALHEATYVAGVNNVTVPDGVTVIVGTDGKLGTMTSSAHYKEAVKPMKEASEAILSLQPVTFHYKKELDPEGVPQFGLVAEEVAKVNPDLVARDKKDFESKIAAQQKQIEALTAGLQRVSAQVEMSRTAPQMVLTNRR